MSDGGALPVRGRRRCHRVRAGVFRRRDDPPAARHRRHILGPGRPSMRLAGERVLVTGSTSGIGQHVAIMCAREGAVVAVHGRDAARGAAVVETIAAAGGDAVFVAADVADEAACASLVDTVAERLGGLTVLVNNAAAGSGGQSPVGAVDADRWERVLRVNLTAVAWLCRPALPHMLAAGHRSLLDLSSPPAPRP